MQNSLESHHKISNIERKTNFLIIYILIIQIILCIVGLIGSLLFLNNHHEKYKEFLPTKYE